MLFNSLTYLLLFLPVALLVYFWLAPRRATVAVAWLVGASFVFYGWWRPMYVPLLAASIAINFLFARRLTRAPSKRLLALGVGFNLALLGFFKYADFAIANLNSIFPSDLAPLGIALPLAISFFTFQQIAFLVDSHRGLTREARAGHYALFVSFFPQLIAGPIVHHSETIPQFADPKRRRFDVTTFSSGLLLLTIGLFKKVVIADTFAIWANAGFDGTATLGAIAAWSASLAYSFQLYFDFSGYTDMALGSALMFNIRLPINFNSPYQASNIQDFWRRWHMTLSRWLRDYLYFPLGGNRRGRLRSHVNLMIVMTLGGLWHGAAWTFVLWGVLHGLALVVHRLWANTGIHLWPSVSRTVTFVFVVAAFTVFRAETIDGAAQILAGMAGSSGAGLASLAPGWTLSGLVAHASQPGSAAAVAWTLAFGGIALTMPNSNSICGIDGSTPRITPGIGSGIIVGLLLGIALVRLSVINATEFLYFNF